MVPQGNLVFGDVMLAQKLAFELEETKVLGECNYFPRDHRRIDAALKYAMVTARNWEQGIGFWSIL